ncbi:TPA: tyrosine-type recombinase/integrase [Legionella pneumophila subsp. pneumophila]|uniref:tyrosine-type recombinase/integrase n=1 Tax=Legionella pneumophila TaxID=446 RepID=UPI00101E2687|nr:site-specific integrase [Legionella pneumophila]HAT9546856.1 tyrosine-type recombinase/integrase [Legionella pneumophila subsp. pneumophila]MCK0183487.1 site-specific integrase [Legionella pneumophila]MCK1881057.1 site-specific integrase [Legionella pneumophila]MCK1890382.1 site-specific integrase [Legionella pneumophila]MCZ4686972.1 site-specific integrase [Legionella pneumophila]
MASIEKRITKEGKVKYLARVRLKGKKPESAIFERLTDARRWANSIESAIHENRHFKTAESKKRTLAELIDRYIEIILPHKSASMQSAQKKQLLWWKDKAGYHVLADFTSQTISSLKEELANGTTNRGEKRTAATVNRYLAALSHALNTAINEWEWIESNPVLKIKKQPESQGRVRYLDDNERSRLLEACKESANKQLHTIVVLALSTGMRKGEILNLKRRDVFLNEGFLILEKTKNKERRRVPIIGYTHEVLAQHLKIARLDSDYVFPSKNGKQPIDIKRPWEVAVSKALVTDFRFHDLRHSCASYLAMNGATQRDLMEVLGHKTVQMTKRYSHLSDNHISSVIGSMNEKIFRGIDK